MRLTPDNILNARCAAHLTRQQAADHLGVHRVVYAWYETGKVPIPRERLRQLGELFGCAADADETPTTKE